MRRQANTPGFNSLFSTSGKRYPTTTPGYSLGNRGNKNGVSAGLNALQPGPVLVPSPPPPGQPSPTLGRSAASPTPHALTHRPFPRSPAPPARPALGGSRSPPALPGPPTSSENGPARDSGGRTRLPRPPPQLTRSLRGRRGLRSVAGRVPTPSTRPPSAEPRRVAGCADLANRTHPTSLARAAVPYVAGGKRRGGSKEKKKNCPGAPPQDGQANQSACAVE